MRNPFFFNRSSFGIFSGYGGISVPSQYTGDQPGILHDRNSGILDLLTHTINIDIITPHKFITEYQNLFTQDPVTYAVTDETRPIPYRCAKSIDKKSQVMNRMAGLPVPGAGMTCTPRTPARAGTSHGA